ncbi:ATP-binding cassette domain-containing protein [Devosia psychrophila]|uniref:ATP-binding cassette domain-containing protein n=1 Tax=Devosia psychrophila TaxID=728005 RepID=UPI00244F01EB|nr:ATP-binding cassette domain-containing protein [Devosia psychrophila]
MSPPASAGGQANLTRRCRCSPSRADCRHAAGRSRARCEPVVEPGETLCLVGESGCGKSITCLAAMGLTAAPVAVKSGRVTFLGQNLTRMGERALADLRGRTSP